MSRSPQTLATTLLGVLGLALGAAPGGAATFVVDSTVDAVDTAPGDGTCLAIVGQDPGCFPLPCFRFGCTLRAAVQEANAWPGADTIVVPPGTRRRPVPVLPISAIPPPSRTDVLSRTVVRTTSTGRNRSRR